MATTQGSVGFFPGIFSELLFCGLFWEKKAKNSFRSPRLVQAIIRPENAMPVKQRRRQNTQPFFDTLEKNKNKPWQVMYRPGFRVKEFCFLVRPTFGR
jgi:hypothetical protein